MSAASVDRELVDGDGSLREAFSARTAAGARAAKGTRTRYELGKRVFDLLIGSVATALALPVMILIGILIAFDSRGPVLFRQQRVGRSGRPFTFYKFRTMWCDARARYPELYAYQYTPADVATMSFKIKNDPRLTRLGRVLRTTSLDELPNLINVIRGDMSLVGPRPEIPEMLPYYSKAQLLKFSVKPGMTGLAQVSGRGTLTFQEMIAADLENCRSASFTYDLKILLRTLASVLKRSGAF